MNKIKFNKVLLLIGLSLIIAIIPVLKNTEAGEEKISKAVFAVQ